MKYWRGYIAAALFAALTWALTSFSEAHSALVDIIYPYASRLIQTSLASWVGGVDVCLWQVIVILLGVVVLATIVLMIIFRWNFFQWLGWVLAGASLLFMLHTGIYGLNYYAGDLSDDIRLETLESEDGGAPYTISELAESALYFRDIANELARQVPRNPDGSLNYPSFEELEEMTQAKKRKSREENEERRKAQEAEKRRLEAEQNATYADAPTHDSEQNIDGDVDSSDMETDVEVEAIDDVDSENDTTAEDNDAKLSDAQKQDDSNN